MDSRDLQDLKAGTLEIYETFFSTTVGFCTLVSTETSIYNETKFKSFTEDIPLVAKVDLKTKNTSPREDMGETAQKYGDFQVPLYKLEQLNLDDEETLLQGYIHFRGNYYPIIRVSFETGVEDIFLFWTLEVGESV